MNEFDDLPRSEFAFPGPLRDRLVAAILDGTKTSTTSLTVQYRVQDEPFPQVGARQAVVDSAEKPVAMIETTDVQQTRLGAVPWEHAREEGEGFSSVAEWRAGHEQFWHSEEMRDFLADPLFTVDDDTVVVLERFRVVRLP